MLARRPNTPPKLQELDRHLGGRMRQCRALKSMSLAQIALLLGCSEAHVRSLEDGARPVSARELELLARVLNTPLAWFFR